MVYVRLVSNPESGEDDETPILAEETTTWIEGRRPSEVFGILMERGLDWEIDLEEAESDDEALEWALADIVARTVRARSLGKTVILDGELVNDDEFNKVATAFMKRTGFVPEVIEDNDVSLILGLVEEEGEEWKNADG